ncbi:SDR family oxidoreductase [Mucilaginibacter sp.]|jgi:nucleoside-diphosphate-sugar epimerase|uniref:SDR family oxidoreductase n=1 Tax=Mucilaginibacter sp. TaxID=1882438 RepID=UPI003561F80C
MTVSILGCGWYGLALAKALVAKGISVKGSTTSSGKLETLSAGNIKPFLIDLSVDDASYDADFFTCDVLVIAIPPKSRSGGGAEYVPKLQRVINAINQNQIQKVILISSTGVYADLNMEVNELTDPQPDTLSGKILYGAEELFRQQTDFKPTIIRFGGLIGPGREPGRFFAGKKDIPNGLAPVNLIELNDCISITEAVLNKDAFGYTFNACTPHHPPKFAFYTGAATKAGLERPAFVLELKEWKIINSINVDAVLGYQYKIDNWDSWLA